MCRWILFPFFQKGLKKCNNNNNNNNWHSRCMVCARRRTKRTLVKTDKRDNNNNNKNLEVAHPQSGSSSTRFLIELEFGNVGFWGRGKTGVPGEKPLGAKERTMPQQTQPMYGVDTGIWTQATLVGGERSHHCAIPCSPLYGLCRVVPLDKA